MSHNYYTPPEVAKQGLKAVHQRPFCANEDSHIVGRFDAKYAYATFPKLELNPPHAYAAIILDVDHPSEKGWPGGKPFIDPNWIVVNTRAETPQRRAGGLHLVYALEVPVARLNTAHRLPLAFLAHIADRLSYHLDADPGYGGVITRNPISPGDRCFTHWARMLPYSLKELDKLLPKRKPPKRRLTGIGRNCDLFQAMLSEVLRPRWADTLGAQGWSEAWLEYVRGQNVVMFAPYVLPDSECRSITKSCFRYWTKQYSQGRFRDIQTMRNGKRWHDDFGFDFEQQTRDVRELKAWGLKQSNIGAMVGLSQSQVSRILSQGL